MRRILLTVHLCVGLVLSLPLLVLGITGALLVFEDSANDAANEQLTRVVPGDQVLPLDTLIARSIGPVQAAHLTSVNFPARADRAVVLTFADPVHGRASGVFVDPYRGAILGRTDQQRRPLQWARDLHTGRMLGAVGKAIVGWSALALVLLALSGLTLWWRAKILTLRAGHSMTRSVFDLHNALGGYLWAFWLLLGSTGAIMHWNALTLSATARFAGEPAPPPVPTSSPGCSDSPPLHAGALLARAAERAPTARVTSLQLPTKPSTAPARIQSKYPEDGTTSGRTLVYVDRCSGQVLYAILTRSAPTSYKLARLWSREIHTGDVFGWPSRIIAALASILLPLMAVTGPWIWVARRVRRTRARAPRVPLPTPQHEEQQVIIHT